MKKRSKLKPLDKETIADLEKARAGCGDPTRPTHDWDVDTGCYCAANPC